jgi:hypothetical protein
MGRRYVFTDGTAPDFNGLMETNPRRPLSPLSFVRNSGAMSMRQNDSGSASIAPTIAARIIDA